MKGWELYSWFDMKCSATRQTGSAPNADSICFALLPGTNRNKTVDEIRRAPIGIAALEQQIAKLASGEEVFWHAPDRTFLVPDAKRPASDPLRRAQAACDKQRVKLTITPAP